MQRRLTPGLALLRVTGFAALLLLFWNPITSRRVAEGMPPLVLLDASLSMGGRGGHWREALDSARVQAKGGVIWRFGSEVRGYDSLPPTDGASRLAPALAAAAGRGGPVVVVTDGAVADLSDIPPDLLRRARVVLLPRAPFFDAFVAGVDGPRRVSAGDTIRLRVGYGTAGMRDAEGGMREARRGRREAGGGMREATLAVNLGGRRLVSRTVSLPDSGIVSTDVTLPASRIPHPGWSALEVRLEGVPSDSEPRDDARVFVLEVSPQPSVVVLAAPPDWDTRFLARTLQDVARVPVRSFVKVEPRGDEWRDAATLAPVPGSEVAKAVAAARLVARVGDPVALARFAPQGAVLEWPTTRSREGDWYVQRPDASPLAGALAGIAWDSLPPATWVVDLVPESSAVAVLSARLARRGAPRPVVVLAEREGRRRAAIAAGGLYRWAFRGGASAEAYRALVAALADWLLAEGEGKGERVVPVTPEVADGLPLVWRWTGSGAGVRAGAGGSQDLVVTLTAGSKRRADTLRFDAAGRAEVRLPPGVYAYSFQDGPERGLVAVDAYSDEWRPTAPVLQAQEGAPAGRLATTAMRDRWWLFVLAIAAFAAEWAWRRRQGLP